MCPLLWSSECSWHISRTDLSLSVQASTQHWPPFLLRFLSYLPLHSMLHWAKVYIIMADSDKPRKVKNRHDCYGDICTARKIPFMYSLFGNCAASVPISTVMCLWPIHILLGLVHIFPCSRIGRPILEIYNLSQIYECRNWKTEHYNSVLEITVSFLGIQKWEPAYIGFSPTLPWECTLYNYRPLTGSVARSW